MAEETKYDIIPEEVESQGDEAVRNFMTANYPKEGAEFITQSEYNEKFPDEGGAGDGEEGGEGGDGAEGGESPFDFSVFGEYKSEEDIKKALQEKEELKKKLEGLGENPFQEDEDLNRIHELSKKDKDRANLIKKVVFGDLPAMEMHLTKFLEEHPGRNKEEVIELIASDPKYAAMFDEDADEETAEYKRAKIMFEDDAKKIKNGYLNEFKNIELPKKQSKEDIENTRAELKTKLESPVSKLLEKDIEYPISWKDGEKDFSFSHVFPKDEVQGIKDVVIELLVNSNEEINEKSLQQAFDSVLSIHAIRNLGNIMNAYRKDLERSLREELNERYNVTGEPNTDKDINIRQQKPDGQAWQKRSIGLA